jgi:hypothetical protein
MLLQVSVKMRKPRPFGQEWQKPRTQKVAQPEITIKKIQRPFFIDFFDVFLSRLAVDINDVGHFFAIDNQMDTIKN